MKIEPKCPECGGALPADAIEGLCPRCLLRRIQATEIGTVHSEAPTTTEQNRPALPEIQEIASLFPDLEIMEILGRGGMGVVYKARQKKLDRFVALKILPAPTAKQTGFAVRFSREARALAKLNHPGIVTIYDQGQAGDLCYLMMEFVEGPSLRGIIQAKSLKSGEALKVVVQICEALQYAHEEGIVHRDIKPGNILIDKRGRVKIADFGLAKLLHQGVEHYALTASQQVMGTPHYMAPEQFEHPLDVDHRADIYSLGVVFYEMLTGDLPLGRFPPPSKKVQIDVRLDEVVLRTLESEPKLRYQRASDVRTDVENITATAAPTPKAAAAPKAAVAPEPPRDGLSFSEVAALSRGPALLVLGIFLLVGCISTIWTQFRLVQTRSQIADREAKWQSIEPQAKSVSLELRDISASESFLAALEAFSSNRFRWSSVLAAVPFSFSTSGVRVVSLRTVQKIVASEPVAAFTNIVIPLPGRSWWQFRSPMIETDQASRLVNNALQSLTNQLAVPRGPNVPWWVAYPSRLLISTSGPAITSGSARLQLRVERPGFVTEEPSLELGLRNYAMTNEVFPWIKDLPLPPAEQRLRNRSISPVVDMFDPIVPNSPFIDNYVELNFTPRFRTLK